MYEQGVQRPEGHDVCPIVILSCRVRSRPHHKYPALHTYGNNTSCTSGATIYGVQPWSWPLCTCDVYVWPWRVPRSAPFIVECKTNTTRYHDVFSRRLTGWIAAAMCLSLKLFSEISILDASSSCTRTPKSLFSKRSTTLSRIPTLV